MCSMEMNRFLPRSLTVFIYCGIYLGLAYGGGTITTPTVEGLEGEAITLPCVVSGQGDLQWRGADDSLILSVTAAGKVVIADGPYKGEVNLVGGKNLQVQTLERDRDEGTFKCQYVGYPGLQQTPVRVLVPISGVQIEEASEGLITIPEGETKTLTCTVTGDPNPPPVYSWRVDQGTATGQGRTFDLTAVRTQKTITCTARNTYIDKRELSSVEATADLNILLFDKDVGKELRLQRRSPVDLNSTTTKTTVAVEKGAATVLECSPEGSPPFSYTWFKKGSLSVIGTSSTLSILKAQRSTLGTYICRATNSAGSQDIIIDLIVQYPPRVTVRYSPKTRTFICTAKGVPANYSFSPWEHRLGGVLVETLGAPSNQSPITLSLPAGLTYEDTGSYVCQVSNGVQGVHKNEKMITPESPAIFQPFTSPVKMQPGTNISISVLFYTHSKTPNVKVEWWKSREGTPLANHHEEPAPVRLTVRGTVVTFEGTITILTLTNVTEADQGDYTLTVTNNINSAPVSREATIAVTVTTEPTGGSDGLDKGAIGGIVGGVVAALSLITGISIGVCLKRKEVLRNRAYEEIGEPKSYKESGGPQTHKEKGAPQSTEKTGFLGKHKSRIPALQ